ncbi:hypothetical protein AGMMS50284_3130 [Clostridia bacterium]|nr:hypothetical protein AGMMS50284_3130 [Clostridia bacterium]
MRIFKKIAAAILVLVMISTCFIISAQAVNDDTQEVAAATGITVHYKGTAQPNIYYWNSLPQNIETAYPGPAMAADAAQGAGWYTYTFANVTKINLQFLVNGTQSKELTRGAAGEYWYKDERWYTKNPELAGTADDYDFRDDTIYFVMTTRFYDGYTGNNVHCWDDSTAGNPDSDPAWRGDFQGLIDKLDYIKALGFSAIWITPVVSNASGYDYHGYHAFDFSTVDVRYESPGATFQDLIDAIHAKDMKVIQDVVWNHTGNFGEEFLGKLFNKQYSTVQDLADIDKSMVPTAEFLQAYPNYKTLLPGYQFQARLAMLKNTDGKNHDTNNYYHHGTDMSWEQSSEQTGQIDGDCVDVNTENQVVADYIVDAYQHYIDMGVDSFRMDTEKHISRWTLNSAYFPKLTANPNFFLFGEVCARVRNVWNHDNPSDSVPFYTWKETKSPWTSNWSTTDWLSNYNNSVAFFSANPASAQPTSNNATLVSGAYHTPDHKDWNGTSTIDFFMHWSFQTAIEAYRAALEEDKYFNDSTYNVTYVDSHDYGPDGAEKIRYNNGTQTWAENLSLLFTFRGVPCIYYGSEIEFKAGAPIDVGPNAPLATTGRAYFGDYIEGSVTASDFSQYTASGKVSETLSNPLSKHIQRLNQIRRAVPALQRGQYESVGEMAYKRAYTDPTTGEKSFACVAVTNGATFTGIPNGTYIDAVTGTTQTVSGGTLTVAAAGKGNMRVYVLSSNGYTGISGKIGTDGAYLK